MALPDFLDAFFRPLYQPLVLFQNVEVYFAFFMNTYFVYRVAKAPTIHVNFKMCVCSAAISFQFMGGLHYILNVIYRTRLVHDPSDWLLNHTTLALCYAHHVCVCAAAQCMSLIGVEQWLATKWVASYERRSKALGCALLSLVFGMSVPLGVVTAWFATRDFNLVDAHGMCIVTDLRTYMAFAAFALASVSCSLAALYVLHLRQENKKRTAHRLKLRTLTARYQQTNNSELNAAIAPSLLGYMLAVVSGAVFQALVMAYNIKYETELGQFLIDVKYVLLDGIGIFHMFCFMTQCRPLNRALRRDLRLFLGNRADAFKSEESKIAPASLDEGNTYFEQIRRQWQ